MFEANIDIHLLIEYKTRGDEILSSNINTKIKSQQVEVDDITIIGGSTHFPATADFNKDSW